MTASFPCAACPLRCPPCERLDDLKVYRLLTELVNALDPLSSHCWSLAAATALSASATVLRAVSSGLRAGSGTGGADNN